MRAARRAWITAVLAAGAAGATEPESVRTTYVGEVRVVDRVERYPILGGSEAEILGGLRDNGIAVGGAGEYRGAYVWRLAWRFAYLADAAGCRVRDALVTLTGVMTLPRLAGAGSVPPALAQTWRDFEERLRAHEERHRELTIAAAQGLRRELTQLKGDDCKALQADADRLGTAYVAALQKVNEDYDWTTEHGRTEGVRWPGDEPPRPAPSPR